MTTTKLTASEIIVPALMLIALATLTGTIAAAYFAPALISVGVAVNVTFLSSAVVLGAPVLSAIFTG